MASLVASRPAERVLSHCSGGHYSRQRCALDKTPHVVRASRKASARYYKPCTAHGAFTSRKRALSPDEAQQVRDRYCAMFPSALELIRTYSCIHQGGKGKCSFVSFLNLTHLTHNFRHISAGKSIVKRWPQVWTSFGFSAAMDLADLLDTMVRHRVLAGDPARFLTYVPIRSRGHSENSYNRSFWVGTPELLRYFRRTCPDLTESVIDCSVFVFQTGYLLERLLARGVYVEVNAPVHSRTCVAFNQTHLLCADNWGDLHEEQPASRLHDDVFSSGFSVVDKWALYSNMRDLVYYSRPIKG